MERSRYLAVLIGVPMLAVSASLLLNRDLVPRMVDVIAQDVSLIFIAGIVTLAAGLAIVLSHRSWRGWPAAVTAFGWLAVLGGAARVLFPLQIAEIAPGMIRSVGGLVPGLAVVVGLFGLFLTWRGLSAPRPKAQP